MLTLFGPRSRYCDRVSRRSFLQIGSLTLGGLTLPKLLAAEERSGSAPRRHKSVIMVYLAGGMSHQDTFDLKPEAPVEIRGEFKPISTSVPGIQVCEHLPKLASMMDRLAVIRSVVGLRDEHSSFQNVAGFPMSQAQREGRPHFGSVVTHLQGAVDPVVPAFVDLFPTMQHRPYNSPSPGFLGHSAGGVKADGEELASMKLRYVSPEEFGARRRLIGEFEVLDTAYARAFDVLTSTKLVEAMDLEKEDPALRDRYGRGSNKPQGDAGPLMNDQLLLARRLV